MYNFYANVYYTISAHLVAALEQWPHALSANSSCSGCDKCLRSTCTH